MNTNPWHVNPIKKGVLGELSKIQEELDEALDAEQQGQDIMEICELTDIIGACAARAQKKYGLSLDQLVKFSKLRSQVALAQSATDNAPVVEISAPVPEEPKPQP